MMNRGWLSRSETGPTDFPCIVVSGDEKTENESILAPAKIGQVEMHWNGSNRFFR